MASKLPPVPRLSSMEDFASIAEVYHCRDTPGDTITYLYAYRELGRLNSRPTPPDGDDVALLVNGYLKQWGGMGRFLRLKRDWGDPMHLSFSRTLKKYWPIVRRLSSAKWARLDEVATNLSDLFDDVVQNIKNRDGQHSPVAAAKTLHILLPNLCIIWDNEYVFKRGLRTKDGMKKYSNRDGNAYVAYLREKFSQISEVATASGFAVKDLARRVSAEHASAVERLVPRMGLPPDEPLTKILDEANYVGLGESDGD